MNSVTLETVLEKTITVIKNGLCIPDAQISPNTQIYKQLWADSLDVTVFEVDLVALLGGISINEEQFTAIIEGNMQLTVEQYARAFHTNIIPPIT